MTISSEPIIEISQSAFARREFPAERIIRADIDLSYHLEAQNVNNYFIKNKDIVDRSNPALAAFIYLTAEAALWALPYYIRSIVRHFKKDDFIIDVMFGALASGMPAGDYVAQVDLGVRMRGLATPHEAEAVCQFCQWLVKSTGELNDSTSSAAVALWCSKTGGR